MVEKLQALAAKLLALKNASMFNKGQAAEDALGVAVSLLGDLVNEVEALKNGK